MKLKTRPTILTAFLAGLFFFSSFAKSAPEAADAAKWMTDFAVSKEKAAAEGKAMLLNFTGSDWCGWCIKLDEEVFSKKAFQDYASENLVLVEVDFPRGKRLPEEQLDKNYALAEKYGVRGYPTIVLLSSEGELLATTGYRRGGPELYVEHLKELLAAK